MADVPAAPGRRSGLREVALLGTAAVVLALLVKAFLVQAFFIPSGSMERTLHGCRGCTGDRVLVNKLVYDVRDVRRGEIVVFSGEGSWGADEAVAEPSSGGLLQRAGRAALRAAGAAPPSHTDYIKRVIGLPGDRVACCSPSGRVTVQPAGADAPVELVEPYVFEDDATPFCSDGRVEAACPPGSEGVLVPEGRLWVMGDHRSESADSRAHMDGPGSGTVPVDAVVGRAFVVVWPFDRIRVLRVPHVFDG